MKNIRNINIILLLFSICLISCNKFLDESPDSRLRLDDLDKISELVVNAYPTGSVVFLEQMSDNVGPDPKNFQLKNITQAYKWETIEAEQQDTPANFWRSCYLAIAHANQAIEALDELNSEDITRANAIRGEALACRAYAHFMLVNVFADIYEPSTAASKLGIVIMEKPEVSLLVKYKRSTIAEVYDFIEKDLLMALSLINDKYYKNTGKYHFTHNATLALLSRYYLNKGDHKSCANYSTELLGVNFNPKYIRNYNEIYVGSTSEIMSRKFTSPANDANLLLVNKIVLYGYMYYAGYRFTSDIQKSISLTNDDLRFKVIYSAGGASVFAPKFERNLMKKASLTSSSGVPYTIEMALRSEEVVLNCLESWANTGEKDLYESNFNIYLKAVYNGKVNFTVLKNFYSKNFPELTEKELMVKIVIEEKRREFIEEGLRWNDIRRHNLTVTHTDINEVTDILTANDRRKTLQIPQSAIEFGGLVPNEMTPPAAVNEAKRVI